jgi:integrase
MRLTKTAIDKLTPPTDTGKRQIFYRDSELKGFAVRITNKGVKTFVVEKRIDGNPIPKRITLGRYGELTAEQARKEAHKVLGKIATGINPIEEKKERYTCSITLKEVYKDYLQTKKLEPSTIDDYNRVMREAFPDWQNKVFKSITSELVSKRHSKLGERSKARANNAMRVLRALFNFANVKYKNAENKSFFPENPVEILAQTGSWYRIKRRKTYIKFHQLGTWFQSIINLENEIIRDYLLHVLFTGLRPTEGAKLEKSWVDPKAKSFTLPKTKNHESHTLPISDYHCEILMHRINASPTEFVFPGTGKKGYISDVRWQLDKIKKETGIKFTVNDLRRTFITIAESLDLSGYTLKRLLNHKIDDSDVTAGYIVTDVERLRKPMHQISNNILSQVWLHYVQNILSILFLNNWIEYL